MDSAKKPTKSIKMQLLLLLVFATVAALEISFFDEVNEFLNASLNLVSDHKLWIMFSALFIYSPIIIMPVGFVILQFEELSNQLQSELTAEKLFKPVILLHVSGAVYASLFWVLQSEGILNAVLSAVSDMNYLLLGSIVFVSYYFSKNLTDPAKLANALKGAICVCFIWVFYFWFGLDDGCTSSGGDGLFTSGDKECDPDYIKSTDSLEAKGIKLGFNSNAGFAAQYLWMVSASFTTTLAVYCFKNRNMK